MKGLPDWVEKHKKKGTAVNVVRGNYYLYKIKSQWDPAKKRARKITEAYLGKITPNGVVASKHERLFQTPKEITIKEFGATAIIEQVATELKANLKKAFPNCWQALYCMAVLRFFYASPLKHMQTHFDNSVLSDAYAVNLNPRNTSKLLSQVGADRNSMVGFMKNMLVGTKHVIIDVTAVFSQATGVSYCSYGHNSQHEYTPQVNLLLLFSKDKNKPVFFRLLPGSIPDVSSIKLAIEESEVSDTVFVGDKGFYSKDNTTLLEKGNINYVLPVKRDSSLINYAAVKANDKRAFDGFFFFNNRQLWFKESQSDSQRVILFLDEHLRVEEEQSYLQRVNKENSGATIDEFYTKQYAFGTIAVVTQIKATPQEVYEYLKSRLNIETAFDTFKNVLEADKTYMRTDQHMQGWMFMNFLSLHLYYVLYGILLQNKLLNKNSPKDIILLCSKVHKIKLNNKEIITEVPKKTRILIQKMKLQLPQTHTTPTPHIT